ncbi:MAG: sugar ABC transporter substrate-binding protein [Opitutales bacterium]
MRSGFLKIPPALAAIACLLLAGCTRPPEVDANRILFSFWGSVQQQKAEEEIIRAFEEAHPDIQVEMMVIGGPRYAEKIQAMFVGNVAPDVVMVNFNYYDDWATRGVLLDLTEEFEAISDEAEFLPIPRRLVERDGRVFGLPINAHGLATYYNMDALAQAGVEIPPEGLTWDFLEEVAPRLSSRHGDPDAPTDYAFFLPVNMSNTVFWQHGVRLFDDHFHPTKVTINTPEAADALEFLRRVRSSGFSAPPEVATDEGTFQLFRDEKVAFYFDGRWRTPEFADRTDFEWNVTPFPAGATSGMTQHGGTILGVASNSTRKEAARKFVRFYASPSGAEIAMHGQRNVPVYRELAYGKEFLALRPPKDMVNFSKTMEDGAALYNLYAPGVSEVGRIFEGRLEQALTRPEIPAQVVLEGLEEDLNRWLKKMKDQKAL